MVTRKNLNTALATSIFLLMVASGLAKAARIYVDASASGNGSGTSWADAFNYLQDALAAASSGDEVWVAEGIYRPDQGTTVLPGSREATFQLINGVALYGGFPAGGGPWQDRDPTAHETILSGDIGTPNGGNAGDNSYHVVTGSGTDATAVLDGFVITAGYADGIARDSYGGGMYNDEGSPTIANCTFRENSAARRGGAIYNKRNNPALSNCILTGNTAGNYGGAIYNQSSNPTITDCTFSGNIALLNGGGMYNGSESCPLLTACTFTGNLAEADGGGMYNYDGSTTTLTDCTFRRNSANGNGGGVWNDATLTLTNCTISGNSAQNKGGGMYCYYGNSTIDGGTISNNKPDAVWIEAGRVRVTGTVQVVSNDLAGGGTLNLEPDATLKLDDSLVLCNLSGTGSIEVDIASELVIQGDAVVDLGDPNDPNKRGHIQCGGLLQMKGNAKIHNANVKFTRGFFGDNSQVSNSIITVDSNAPYGQFFIDPNVSLVGNVFIVDGDRYGDMRPSVFEGVFQNNRIYVTITEGVGEPYGGLFELRGKDGFVTTSCQPDEFFCQAIDPNTPIPDCNVDTWTVEGMELIKGAKLTLTNRFAFQPPFDPGTDDDVFYVKELILREDSVFNTSFNRVYCGSLTVEPNASIVNVPLLGFSLIRIALDDDTEFIHRVTHNNLEHPEDPNYNRTHAARIEGSPPDPNGMMELRNTADLDPNSPTCGQMINARAKGLFAKASEDQVLIMFEYLFVEDPCEDAELIVYLSDRPQVDQNLVEMARVQPPEPNRPGSIGSDTFALFSGIFPRGSLEFTRGTYVGLELCGTGTRCWIDDWDPQVNCTAICGDFYLDMFNIVNVYDYLVLLAEFGLLGPATAGKGCLDLVTDGCVNNEDLIAWGVDEVLNKCPSGEGASVWDEPATTEPLVSALQLEAQTAAQSGAFLVFGKPPTGIGADVPESYLYSIDDAGTCTGDAIEPACPAASCEDADGRFVTDGSGNIYQVNGNLGLVRQDTQDVVVEPNILDFETSRVSVGFNEGTGLLLLDAAFSPADANIVYVLPVLVDPQDGNCPYMAAAKLQLTGQGNYNLLKLYGRNPATDPCQKNTLTDCDGELMYEPDVQHLHEIEIDADGNNVFVLSAYWFNDNYWVLIYDEEVGNDSEIRVSLSDANIVGPTALLVSSFDDKAYVASSVTTSDDLTTEVYRFSVNKTGHVATGLTYDGCLDINCPEPNICQTTPAVCDDTLGFTSAITSMAENPRDGTLYVTGFTAPKFAEAEALPSQIDGIFTTPILAVLPFDVNEPVEAAQIANCDPSFPLVLPLSIVRTGPVICSTADVTGDLIVDMDDFAILALHWLDSNCIQAGWCDGADMNRSNAVDWTDVAVLTHYWLQTPCSD